MPDSQIDRRAVIEWAKQHYPALVSNYPLIEYLYRRKVLGEKPSPSLPRRRPAPIVLLSDVKGKDEAKNRFYRFLLFFAGLERTTCYEADPQTKRRCQGSNCRTRCWQDWTVGDTTDSIRASLSYWADEGEPIQEGQYAIVQAKYHDDEYSKIDKLTIYDILHTFDVSTGSKLIQFLELLLHVHNGIMPIAIFDDTIAKLGLPKSKVIEWLNLSEADGFIHANR